MAEKDPDAPEKPLSAFFWFCNYERSKVYSQHPGLGAKGLDGKELGRRWANLDEVSKKKFHEMANEDRERYQVEKFNNFPYQFDDFFEEFVFSKNPQPVRSVTRGRMYCVQWGGFWRRVLVEDILKWSEGTSVTCSWFDNDDEEEDIDCFELHDLYSIPKKFRNGSIKDVMSAIEAHKKRDLKKQRAAAEDTKEVQVIGPGPSSTSSEAGTSRSLKNLAVEKPPVSITQEMLDEMSAEVESVLDEEEVKESVFAGDEQFWGDEEEEEYDPDATWIKQIENFNGSEDKSEFGPTEDVYEVSSSFDDLHSL